MEKFCEALAKAINRENIISVSMTLMLGWLVYQIPLKLDTIITKLSQCGQNIAYRPEGE